MKINYLLDDIMDSKAKIRILRTLFQYPVREFTEREIAHHIGMSPNTVNLALKDLRKTNVFLFKRLGRTHSFKCNRDSVLFNLFTNLFESEKQVKTELFYILQKNLKSIGTCIVYGSYAEGEEVFDSDLDVLIVTNKKSQAEEHLNEASAVILEAFSIVVSPVIFTIKEFKARSKKSFIKNALENGILITGRDLNTKQ